MVKFDRTSVSLNISYTEKKKKICNTGKKIEKKTKNNVIQIK